MRLTCPECGCIGSVQAFLAEDDAKRLIAAVVDLPAVVQRPVLSYIGLFKPTKNALALNKALRLVREVAALIDAGTVSRDDRSGHHLNASPETWAMAIEAMLHQRADLKLPLNSHGYLRAVAFGLADSTAAKAETALEQQRQSGQHRRSQTPQPSETPMQRDLAFISQQVGYGAMTEEEADAAREKVRQKYGVVK